MTEAVLNGERRVTRYLKQIGSQILKPPSFPWQTSNITHVSNNTSRLRNDGRTALFACRAYCAECLHFNSVLSLIKVPFNGHVRPIQLEFSEQSDWSCRRTGPLCQVYNSACVQSRIRSAVLWILRACAIYAEPVGWYL